MEKFDQSNLTGRQLALFLAVYDTGSVSVAAGQLGLNQSTVSYTLDKLREAFADPLFVKSGRGIVATDRATILAPEIRKIIQNLEGLARQSTFLPAKDNRPITVAANVMELLPLLQKLKENLIAQAPLAELRFLELGSRDSIKDLLNHNLVDVVISVRPVSLPNSLKSETVFINDVVCFYDHEVRGPVNSVEDFVASGHATLDFGSSSKSTIDLLLENQGLERKVMLRAPNAFALGSLIKGTQLISSMQKSLRRSAMSGLSVCPHPLNVPEATFDLIWHRKSDNSPRGKWLREAIKSQFGTIDIDSVGYQI